MSGLRSSSHYSYLFKVRVIGEVLSGSLSKEEVSKKYEIKGHSTISKWIRKLDSGHTTRYPKSAATAITIFAARASPPTADRSNLEPISDFPQDC